MKKILFVLFVLTASVAIGQGVRLKGNIAGFGGAHFVGVPPGYTKLNVRYEFVAMLVDSGLHVPQYNGVPSGVRTGVWVGDGAVAVDTLNGYFYWYSGGAWIKGAKYSDVPAAYTAGDGLLLTGTEFKVLTKRSITIDNDSLMLVNDSTGGAYYLYGRNIANRLGFYRPDTNYIANFSTMVRPLISLTTTGSSGAATYSNVTGVLNIPQYSGGSSGGGPVTYVTAPSAITDTFNLVNSTWVQQSDVTWNGMIDENFVLVDERFNTNQTLNLVYGGAANDTRVSGGIFSAPGSTTIDTLGIAWGFNAQAAFYSFSVPIVKPNDAGTVDKIQLAITDEAEIDSANRKVISVVYDHIASTNNVKIYVRKSGTDNLRATASLATTIRPPFDLSLTINSQSVSVAYRIPNGDWKPFTAYLMDTTSDYDMRDTATLKDFNKAAVYFIREGNNGYTSNIGGPTFGYSKGVSFANPSLVSYDDGTPVTKGNDFYMASSLTGTISGTSGDEQIRTTPFNVLKVNPTTGSASVYQKVFVERSGKIYGENSGSITYDSTRNKWIYLIPNWGSYGILATTSIYKYETSEFKNGVVILRDGTLVSGLYGTTQYDPDLKKIGGTWYLAYTSGYGGVDGVRTATSADLSTWAQQRSYATASEGTKIIKIGGKWRVLAAILGSGTQVVLDTTLTSLGTYTKPSNVSIGSVPAHPTIIPVRANDRTEYYWMYFDNKTYAGTTYSWGEMKILKAEDYQVGHDFAVKNYSDIGELTQTTVERKITEPGIFKWIYENAYFEGEGIGIGTNSSTSNGSYRLHVYKSTTTSGESPVLLQNASTGSTGITLKNSNTGNDWKAYISSEATPTFIIAQNSASNYLAIRGTSGNIGIGTLTSQHPLQVFGVLKVGGSAGQQTGTIALGDDASTGVYNSFYRGTSTGAVGGGNWVNVAGYDGINFMTGNAVIGSQTKRMGIDVNGYITTAGRLQGFQGTDVASAAGAITLTNGNTFEVTGTAAITLISNTNWQNGSIIYLVFTTTAVLTDGTANSGTNIGMELAGGANFTGSADDVVTLVLSEMGGTQRWREVARSVN